MTHEESKAAIIEGNEKLIEQLTHDLAQRIIDVSPSPLPRDIALAVAEPMARKIFDNALPAEMKLYLQPTNGLVC